MATRPNQQGGASAPSNVIPFPKQPVGPIFERSPAQFRDEQRAVHDAHLICEAKATNDDWTARLLLALLETLDRKQLELLEFRLLGPSLNTESACQALALVQLATGDKRHREGVRAALGRLPLEGDQ